MDSQTRDSLPDWQFAGPHRSFPINSQEDVEDAAKLIGHADDPTEVRKNVIKIAKKLRLKLPKSWSSGEATQDDIYDALTGVHDLLQQFLEKMSIPATEDNSLRNPAPFHVEGITEPKWTFDNLEELKTVILKDKDVIMPYENRFMRITSDGVKDFRTLEEAYNAD